jgi:polyhydroxybutyrate depolymerase
MYKIVSFIVCTCILVFGHAQAILDSVLVHNNYRSFYYQPLAKTNKKTSIIFAMHGSGGNGSNMLAAAANFFKTAEAENVLFVAPNGYKTFWNECRKFAETPPNIENIDEAAFFKAMLNYFNTKYKINTNNIFAMGFSGGGHMTYKLGFTMPTYFKALTAIVANIPTETNFDCTKANMPMPIMIVNGTNDEVNPYNGGLMKSGTYFGHIIPTDSSFAYWATIAGYKGAPTKTLLPNTDTLPATYIEKYTYKQKRKPEVTLLKVVGGQHAYPTDIDVFMEAWAFFKRSRKK